MKLKNVIVLLGVMCMMILFYYWMTKETFKKDDVVMDVLEKFCNDHCGSDWTMDNMEQYNDKLVFVVIQTKDATISLSIQPINRAIIIENIKGKSPFGTKRVFRF